MCTSLNRDLLFTFQSFPFWGHATSRPASVHCNAAMQLCWAWSVYNLHQDLLSTSQKLSLLGPCHVTPSLSALQCCNAVVLGMECAQFASRFRVFTSRKRPLLGPCHVTPSLSALQCCNAVVLGMECVQFASRFRLFTFQSFPFWGHAMSRPASVCCNAATKLCWAWSVYNLHLGSDCLRFKASPFGAMPCHAHPQCAATLQQSCVGHGVCTICI